MSSLKKHQKSMGSTLRNIFATCFALFLLSGCSLFDDAVENCEEPQEYQESASMPPLIVPNYLKNIQDKSIFNIPNTQGNNAFAEDGFVKPMASDKSSVIAAQNNQIANIEDDELSELLQLIDQTISNRQVQKQFEPIYEDVLSDYESNPTLKPCIDGPPKYFSEKISPRTMPSQTYTQPSDVSATGEEEKSRRQKRREKRQQKTGKQPSKGTEEDLSSKDSEAEIEDKVALIWKAMTGAVLGFFTGGSSESTTLAVGQSVVPPEPTKPSDAEITDSEIESDLTADKIRSLAVLDPALNDEQRLFIQNMSDKQILEMVAVISKQVENKDINQGTISGANIIKDKASTTEDDDWFTRVKDQWTVGKAQREARREARQQRRTGGEGPKEEISNTSNQNKNQEKINNEPQSAVNANEVLNSRVSKVENQDSADNMSADDEIIEEQEAKSKEDDWFTQVKDQWTEGKAEREERREARQQRRAERQAQDD